MSENKSKKTDVRHIVKTNKGESRQDSSNGSKVFTEDVTRTVTSTQPTPKPPK